jgi:hypothetical protein
MEEWKTVWDHKLADFQSRSIAFASGDDVYRIDVDVRNQDEVTVNYRGKRFSWPVFTKEAFDKAVRLSGMTTGRGDPHGDETFWFQLTLGNPAVLRLFGDRVLLHEDHEALK